MIWQFPAGLFIGFALHWALERVLEWLDDRRQHQLVHDLMLYGQAWTKDGKRVDPKDIYVEPAARSESQP